MGMKEETCPTSVFLKLPMLKELVFLLITTDAFIKYSNNIRTMENRYKDVLMLCLFLHLIHCKQVNSSWTPILSSFISLYQKSKSRLPEVKSKGTVLWEGKLPLEFPVSRCANTGMALSKKEYFICQIIYKMDSCTGKVIGLNHCRLYPLSSLEANQK